MRKNGSYADDLHIKALAVATSHTIKVLTWSQSSGFTQYAREGGARVVTIIYWPSEAAVRCHYTLALPTQAVGHGGLWRGAGRPLLDDATKKPESVKRQKRREAARQRASKGEPPLRQGGQRGATRERE
jgi:hypothetical protein